ncbi:hypothetical protein ACH5RR_031990 [Cinchona calisaya]|uniref:Sulfotransferase n=1 Tax=Cinchona calisaya TaxID=153742 RepID=A0ABD2YGT8_9GENT
MELSNFMQEFLPSLPSEKWWAGESLYQFNGFWFYPPHLYGVQKVLSDFKPLSIDIILACHPKTGTTWLKSLLFAIIYRSYKKILQVKFSHDLIPTLETKIYSPFVATRTVKCEQGKPWPLDLAVDQFYKGTLPFGPYYDHVLGYRKESLERPEKVLFMTYEELKDDPKTHVKKLAKFLGCPFENDENGEEELEDIVRSCSFETLSNLEVNKSSELTANYIFPYNAYFRKGQVGDHLNFLKPEMIQRIDETTNEKFGADVNFLV